METNTFSRENPTKNNRTPLLTWIKIALGMSLILGLIAVLFVAGVIVYFSQGLPALDSAGHYAPSQATRVYDNDKEVIGQYYIEKRVFIPFEEIPKHLIHAILAVEDSRFYEHKGFDPIRIVRAFLANLESGRIRQGASTITQQVTRSLFLTPERTIQRKIKELILSQKMERLLTKNQILEIYLNQIYFGHGAYGVQVASKTYFGKKVSDITVDEAAFLAGLPKAPNNYSPYRHPKRAKSRQRIVLKRMFSENYITESEYKRAYNADILFQKLRPTESFARYYKEHVRQYLIARYGEEVVYKGGLKVYTTLNKGMQLSAEKAVTEGLRALDKRQGYRGPIRTFQEPEDTLTEFEKIPQKSKEKKPIKVGEYMEARILSRTDEYAIVEASGHKGKVLLKDMLWAARRLTGPDVRKDRKLIEKATPHDILGLDDIVQVRVKQLASVSETQGQLTTKKSSQKKKKFADALLFSLEQEPIVQGAFIAIDPATGAVSAMVGGYDFKTSEFNRATMARRQPGSAFKPVIYAAGIEKGLTPATILIDNPVIFTDEETNKVWKPQNYEKRFYGQTSLREALTHSRNLATVKLLQEVGIRSVEKFAKKIGIESKLTPDLSLALGSSGVSLLEMTSSLSVFANEGIRVTPTFILSVTDSEGKVLESRDLAPKRVISKETAYVITNILEDVVQRGTAKRARRIGRPIAGKTGTTNGFTDAWFVGYGANLAAGVWVGFDNNQSLGYKESGGRAALPIWVSFMEEALATLPVVPFSIPENIIYAKIDPNTGYLSEEGEQGEYEIFVKGTEPVHKEKELSSPTEFLRIDQESDSF